MDYIQKIKLLNELMLNATPQNVDFTPQNGNYCVALLRGLFTLGDTKSVTSRLRDAWKKARRSLPI